MPAAASSGRSGRPAAPICDANASLAIALLPNSSSCGSAAWSACHSATAPGPASPARNTACALLSTIFSTSPEKFRAGRHRDAVVGADRDAFGFGVAGDDRGERHLEGVLVVEHVDAADAERAHQLCLGRAPRRRRRAAGGRRCACRWGRTFRARPGRRRATRSARRRGSPGSPGGSRRSSSAAATRPWHRSRGRRCRRSCSGPAPRSWRCPPSPPGSTARGGVGVIEREERDPELPGAAARFAQRELLAVDDLR